MKTNVPLLERFWSRVKVGAPNECWPWQPLFVKTFASAKDYGHFTHKWVIYHSHRLAWEFTYGPVPDGLWVLHKCDNPPCCNPRHLFLGTDLDNKHDSIAKGRARYTPQPGEKHGQAKLTEDDVRFIRAAYKPGEVRLIDLARWFGIDQAHVSEIVHRHKWKHLD